MASDSRCTSGDPDFATQKIFVASDGTLIGFAGMLVDGVRFAEWVQAGADRASLPEFSAKGTFSALTLGKSGCFAWDNECVPMAMRDRFYALGTGAMAAITARRLGRTLEEAVEIACLIDSCSAPPVVVEFYKEIKLPARKRATKTKRGASK